MTVQVSATLSDLSIEGDRLVYPDGSPFDMEAYSRFKYGYTAPAQDYGFGLANHFVDRFPELALSSRRVLVSSASYKFVPSASNQLAIAFRDALNCYRVSQGHEPAMLIHTIRFTVGSDSYANGGLEEREGYYAKMGRHVDAGLVRDSVLVFVDDVRITGATEKRFHKLVLPLQPYALCTTHYARVDEEQALAMPSIENVMNKFRFPTLDAIASDIKTGQWALNSRVLRTILEHGDTDPRGLYSFLEGLNDILLQEMLVGLMSGTVEMWNRLPNGKRILIDVCKKRNLGVARLIR